MKYDVVDKIDFIKVKDGDCLIQLSYLDELKIVVPDIFLDAVNRAHLNLEYIKLTVLNEYLIGVCTGAWEGPEYQELN